MTGPDLESRRALHELIALLQEIDERYLGEEWGSPGFGDTVDGFHTGTENQSRSGAFSAGAGWTALFGRSIQWRCRSNG